MSESSESQAMFADNLKGEKNKVSPEITEEQREKLNKIKAWWAYTRSIQAPARAECLKDHDIYDGDQWDPDDKAEVEARGQIATVFNRVKPTIDWIIGSEKKNRIDFRVLPRTSEDAKPAEAKTHILKYLSDVNKLPTERSQAFKDTVISGLGWLEAGVTKDVTKEPIFIDYEDWRNIWYDPLSVRLDLKDARFMFRRKRVDLDVACSMFSEFSGALKILANSSVIDEGAYSQEYADEDTDLESMIEMTGFEGTDRAQRNRLELVECWYKTPENIEIMDNGTQDLGTLRGQKYHADDPAHKDLVEGRYASLTSSIRMVIRCMIFAGDLVLQDQESPYNHNRFPFIPIWGFRKKKDNTQYGPVRNLRDIQDDLNKRRSKALFILSTNQIIADDDAVTDWDELADEVSRPDGIIKKKKGSEIEINNDRGLAQEHVALMNQDAEYIEAVGGVTDEQMGRETNAISGKAIEARKEQGNIVNSEVFDNLRVSTQMLGEIILSLIEQYYTDQKIFRITNEKNQPEFIEINGVDPETNDPLNDITKAQADFVVDSSAWTASIRQATFETLMEMIKDMAPEIAINLLDLVVDLSDIPGKEDLVARIRMVNGQSDPDADQNDPDLQAEQDAQRQADEAQALFDETMQKLEMSKLESEIDKNVEDAAATRAGVKFDQEKLRIDKAKALHDIQIGNKALNQKVKPAVTKTKDRVMATKQGEHGIKSDNKKKGAK
ncbi:MAG: hypothetical protein HOG03_11525 [Desulfobacula sp.]|jgi:hypothetical protein|uniref:portal protein n=2 Tax=Desulfobacula sp. TaxID=2593537 RepID=UPI001D7B5CD3|nr:hypothetical protein [Desulfobacula sp.]MBT3805213.1 hypothetical protein [Desulfobacula sp.]MBT4024546.1 hypothetical protein [Desulfobacula sp.]MBT4199862.1 hypothetical protein [Desulfobacula sp.]MBT4507455.1 hypothetical protein [Desulfobacula sp.]